MKDLRKRSVTDTNLYSNKVKINQESLSGVWWNFSLNNLLANYFHLHNNMFEKCIKSVNITTTE